MAFEDASMGRASVKKLAASAPTSLVSDRREKSSFSQKMRRQIPVTHDSLSFFNVHNEMMKSEY